MKHGKDTCVMKKIPLLILAATLIVITVRERKKVRGSAGESSAYLVSW